MADRFSSRRLTAMLTLGFASGLPYALIRDPLKAWMTQRNFSITAIGAIALLTYPASLKFLWAPLMDRYVPPLLGRRRGWLLITQLMLVVAIVLLGLTAGRESLLGILEIGFVLAFFAASQDIVGDAYRTDVLAPAERGLGIAFWVNAYRLAILASGAGSLYLVGRYHWSWSSVYFMMAGLMALGLIATWVAPAEPESQLAPPTLKEAIVQPLADLLLRDRGWMVLLFVFLFKVPEMLAASLTQTFMQRIGIPIQDIGKIKDGLGIAVTIAGVLAGGAVVTRIGLWKSLWVCGLLGAISNLGFFFLARAGPVHYLMIAVVCIESFCAGMVAAAFVTYLTAQCSHEFSATQFALLSSIAGLSEPVLGPRAAAFAQHFGWPCFFIGSILAGVPSLALLLLMPKQTQAETLS
jgi:PAT family beta-lactamase induction signal transducer AmpG